MQRFTLRALHATLLAGVLAALIVTLPASPAIAAPTAQTVDVSVTLARLQVFPLGSARVQMVLTNSTSAEQVFALEILLVRADGSIATAYLSDALALGPGITATAIYTLRHADGAVEAVVTPRRWPNLGS